MNLLYKKRMNNTYRIYWVEPIFYLFFGLLHLHRIWAFIDRDSYSGFWRPLIETRNLFYFAMMGAMSALCVTGIEIFVKNRGHNQWWRWVYIFGGAYLLFDLFAIFFGLSFWRNLLYWMFDVANPFWNVLWGAFVVLGSASFLLGIMLGKRLIV